MYGLRTLEGLHTFSGTFGISALGEALYKGYDHEKDVALFLTVGHAENMEVK